jgi:hypothetical protein
LIAKNVTQISKSQINDNRFLDYQRLMR